MTFWQLTVYRESGFVLVYPLKFLDVDAARYSAELVLMHYGPDYTVLIEEQEDDGAEPQLRSAHHDPAANPATNNSPS